MPRRSSTSRRAHSTSSPKRSNKPYDSHNRRSESPSPLSAASPWSSDSAGYSSHSDSDGSFTADFTFPSSEPRCVPGPEPRQPRVFDIPPNAPIPPYPTPADVPGCPSYIDYKALEADYLAKMTPTKLSKALVSTETLVCVADHLRNPYPLAYTPQFRFWVRKMFSMGHEQTQFDLPAVDLDGECLPIVIHDGRPVAVKEQLYEILCHCHLLTGHAGRDRTSATVWARYSWIPKELIARFVRACPTCTTKRSGKSPDLASPECVQYWTSPPDTGAATSSRVFVSGAAVDEGSVKEEPMDLDLPSPACYHDRPHNDLTLANPSNGSPQIDVSAPSDASFSPDLDFLSICLSPDLSPGPPDSPLSATSSGFPSPLFPGAFDPNPADMGNPFFMGSLPMVREVSLYDGMPNGWEVSSDVRRRHLTRMADIAEAPARPALQRPEIPVSLPKLRNMHSAGDIRPPARHTRNRLPPISRLLSAGNTPTFASPEDDAVKQGAFAAMIDPALLPRIPPPALTHTGQEDNELAPGLLLDVLGLTRTRSPAPPSRMSFADRRQAADAARADAIGGKRRVARPVALRVTTDSLRVPSVSPSSRNSSSVSDPPTSAYSIFSPSLSSSISSGPSTVTYLSSARASTLTCPSSSNTSPLSPLSPSSIPVLSPTTVSPASPFSALEWRQLLTPVMGSGVDEERGVYGWKPDPEPDVTEEWLNMELIEQEEACEETKTKMRGMEMEMGRGGVGGWVCENVGEVVI